MEDKIALKLAPVPDGLIVSPARRAKKEAVGVVENDIIEQHEDGEDGDDQEGREVEEDIVNEYGERFGTKVFRNQNV